jgi:hypothetical protein
MTNRKIEIARGLWGATLFTAPGLVLDVTGGDPDDRASRLVMRILGARQVTQAVLSGIGPTGPVLALGVWVDVAHATTSVALAVTERRYTRPAAVDASIATGWALAGLHALNHHPPQSGEPRRSQLARTILAVLPRGRYLLAKVDAGNGGCGFGGPALVREVRRGWHSASSEPRA